MNEMTEDNAKGIQKLLKSTSIYMIGSMLSKVLNLVMLPYISVQLNADQFGVYDLIQTITNVALPIFTIQAVEAAFRFVYLVDAKEKGRVLSNVWAIILCGSCLFGLLLFILGNICGIEYSIILFVYFIFNMFVNMYQRVARCYDNNKVYALSGIIQTFSMLAMQYGFLAFFDMKEEGLVYAYAFSVVIVCIYIEYKTQSMKVCSISLLDFEVCKKIIRFSAPLIPNSISWWAISSFNRIIIVAFIGYSANGIYSMSNKFASIVTMVASTFQLAWQEYALSEKNNANNMTLFSEVFHHFMIVLAYFTAAAILVQQLFFNILIDVEYQEAFNYIPLVMLGVAFSSLSSFYGTGYFIFEKTTGAFKTTVIGAIINLLLCICLVEPLGLYGISIAGMVAYLFTWLIRHFSMKSYFCINMSKSALVEFVFVIAISTWIFYFNKNGMSLILGIILLILFIKKYYKIAYNYIKKR